NRLETTLSACWRARRSSDRWPSCNAPMVGTRAMRAPLARQAATRSRSSALVRIDGRLIGSRLLAGSCRGAYGRGGKNGPAALVVNVALTQGRAWVSRQFGGRSV